MSKTLFWYLLKDLLRIFLMASGTLAGIIEALSQENVQAQERLRRLPKTKEYVAYCRGPYCIYADHAVAALQRSGRRARRLLEGFPEWKAAGLPVEEGEAA